MRSSELCARITFVLVAMCFVQTTSALAQVVSALSRVSIRVLEIPTPRWVVYDKVRLGAEIPEDAELIGQERAYTSPIWYTP